MAEQTDSEVVELEDALVRPGTYFNPQTEVVVVVDDSVSLDQEIFNMEAYEGADWVRISDDVPIDEDARDHLIEDFQTRDHRRPAGSAGAAIGQDDDEHVEDEEELEPDPDPEE